MDVLELGGVVVLGDVLELGGVVVLGDVLELGGVVDELVAVESVVIMQHCCRYVSTVCNVNKHFVVFTHWVVYTSDAVCSLHTNISLVVTGYLSVYWWLVDIPSAVVISRKF